MMQRQKNLMPAQMDCVMQYWVVQLLSHLAGRELLFI
jgi:hypothetical protein